MVVHVQINGRREVAAYNRDERSFYVRVRTSTGHAWVDIGSEGVESWAQKPLGGDPHRAVDPLAGGRRRRGRESRWMGLQSLHDHEIMNR